MEPKEEKNNTPSPDKAAATFDAVYFRNGEQLAEAIEAKDSVATEHWSRELQLDYNISVSDLATADLIAGLRHENPSICGQSASALGTRNDPGVVNALLDCANNPESSIATVELALDALNQIGSREAIEGIAKFLDHEHEAISSTAISALQRHASAGEIDLSSVIDAVRESYANREPGEEARLHYLTLDALGWNPTTDQARPEGSMFEHGARYRTPEPSPEANSTAYVSRDSFTRPDGVTPEVLDTSLPWKPGEDIVVEKTATGIRTNVAWSVYGGDNGFGFNPWEPSKELALNILNQVVPPGEDDRPVVDFKSPYWEKSFVNLSSDTAAALHRDFANEVLARIPGDSFSLSVDDIKDWVASKQVGM